MMQTDCFGLAMTAANRETVSHYDETLRACLGFRSDTVACTARWEAILVDHPRDIWAVHAVAHVHEMTGRSADGIAWLKATEDGWRGCNNFAYHVWWHRALYHFERAQYDDVLGLYDGRFRADQSDDYLDISNAVAMLWRLESVGVFAGGRWRELADKAEQRSHDHLLAFADLHFAIALAADGRQDALNGEGNASDAGEARRCADRLLGA